MSLGSTGRLFVRKGPAPHRSDCEGRIVPDVRTDTTWNPPKTETRERCLKCGWEGPWWALVTS